MFFAFFFNVSLACMFSLMISVYRHAIIIFLCLTQEAHSGPI
jgi:hypothetical protein